MHYSFSKNIQNSLRSPPCCERRSLITAVEAFGLEQAFYKNLPLWILAKVLHCTFHWIQVRACLCFTFITLFIPDLLVDVAIRIIQLAVALHWSHTVDVKASQGMFLTSQNAFLFEDFCITVKIL